ncbi:hypothetical protein G6F46_012053 [Rhizopus delemar]|uniref:Uncharacterized protein n=2 Tax=Rhizopus TaxID=4842 RepID=A0A9P6YRW5_9FUNG|nr:hypothetical protein G6F43_012320 [Rhizopus delemar]KAG1534304.1 hypothetical protein G6F51_012168 [Rhizopus arrhizus]KAG1445974.1 hypothetical protein G6F55_011734 [Rhizopus delemar]KAG1488800.1 hypothetical protein G6F54_011874 [Rhizopus delemar]KAG1497414.1 hypothetical protein G6F53_011974 [Rhizopus delemar]
MNNAEENEEIAQAIALSLRSHIEEQEQENEELKVAIAASLGKTVDQLTARDLLLGAADPVRKRKQSEEIDIGSVTKRVDLSNAKYWEGTVKLTYVKGFTGPDYVTLKDIIQKNDLKKAVVTSFVYSMDYIDEHFPINTNMVIVTHGRPAIGVKIGENRIIIQPPLKDNKYGVFHNKLMLLFRSSSLRVVIGSANMVACDYEELENVVFMQDFPELIVPLKSESDFPEFAKDICDVLDKMRVPTTVKEELLKYDFSKAKARIVASVSGVFEGEEEYKKYGHTRLADIVRDITGPLDPNNYPKVEMQTSSLGSLSVSYLQEIYQSFCGISSFSDGKAVRSSLQKNQLPPIDIIFPTRDTVTSSRYGGAGADSICFNTATWRKPTFPKQVMCDSISHRQGALMHSKYIIATLPNSKSRVKGWIYCGSHNSTTSAWGKFTVSKASKLPKLSISNWELGVVFPLYEDTDIPAPFLRPPPRYQPEQDAWTQNMEW